MLDEEREPTLHDLAGHLLNQVCGHILQHHRVQRKAARALPSLDQATAV